jgi:N-acetylneuraminate lyase
MSLLEGAIPALVTPFTKEDEVDVKLLQELIEWQLAQKAGGLYLTGSTGEGFLMSIPERQLVVETVVKQVRGRVPVVSQVGALASRDAAALAKGAEAAGADGVSAVPPFYFRVDYAGLKLHYATIGSACGLPLYLYNVPATTGVLVTAAQFGQLIQDVPTVAGMKYTAYDFFNMRQIIELDGGRLNIVSGPDEMFLPALSMGVDGAIGTTLNYMCLQFHQIYQAFKAGDMGCALEIQSKVNHVIAVLLKYGTLGAINKAPLRFLGFDIDDGRAPIRPLTDQEREKLRADLEEAGFFDLERN